MTILILAQQKLVNFEMPRLTRRLGFVAGMEDMFSNVNRKGILSGALLLLIGVSVISYLIALYLTFGLGFSLQKNERAAGQLQNSVSIQEVALWEKEANLAENNKSVIESMEKITALKYVTPDNVAVSMGTLSP